MTHPTFQAGDVLYVEDPQSQQFFVYKILRIETWHHTSDPSPTDPAHSTDPAHPTDPADLASETWHILAYRPLSDRPSLSHLTHLEPQTLHVPVPSFPELATFLAHIPATATELAGYLEYLKLTHFNRYLEETHQDLDTVIHKALAHYQEAYDLTTTQQFDAALAAYAEAIDTFPMLYEAMDNRGLLYMELGRYEDAIDSFSSSLAIEPDGMRALLSAAECYYKLNEIPMAERYFEAAAQIEPDNLIAQQGLQRCFRHKG